MRNILYIGNNLAKKTNYTTSFSILASLLTQEGYHLTLTSNKMNKMLRLLEMLWTTFCARNSTDFILIDTYSTLNFYYAFLVSQLAKMLNINYIPILHGGDLPNRLAASPILCNAIFKHSYKNVAPSLYLKRAFEKHGYTAVCIPNTVPIEQYVYQERNPIQPKILWVRAFKKLYNPTMAIAVLALVKKQFPSAQLCMVGPVHDASFSETKEVVSQLALTDSVEFTGVLSKPAWHKKATEFDVFINTTNFDNTPITVLEAMALGLPVVSTNVGGMPFLIENGIDGVLVNKENPAQMAAAIIDVITENKQSLAQHARTKVERFGWQIVKEQWQQILH